MSRSGRSGRRYRFVSPSERELIALAVLEGRLVREVAAAFGSTQTTVRRIRDEAVLSRRRVSHSSHRLSFGERERISRGIAAGESGRAIAKALGRSASTVCREIRAGGGRRWYRAVRAERCAQRRLTRPKPTKLAVRPRLLAWVEQALEDDFSPQQISARLKLEFPDDAEMRISHETIYQSLYVQSRGELRRQLTAHLRTGRNTRRARGRVEHRGRIPDMVNISQRPAEVDDRAVPGHWEGDLLVGKDNRCFIATLVERQTRYVLLAQLGHDRSTKHVIDALKQRIQTLPEHLRRSLTWDQGLELAAHKTFTVDTGVKVYFCDPRSPWQRGSNENTNGLLRQYLPKSSDLAARSQIELDQIADKLNRRPRQTLAWMTPAEKMTELLR